MLALVLVGFAVTIGFAVWHDSRLPVKRPAVEARLIGNCGGRILAGMRESQFPRDCEWIEPIHYQESN